MMQTAVVLMNLGTPAAPTASAIRSYLRDFLTDRRVVELPRLLWYPILFGPLLTFRPRRLAAAYEKLWEHFGESPLRAISQRQVRRLQQRLDSTLANAPQVRLAMTYGEPALADVVAELRGQGVEHILVLPLYPQFSATTTGAIYDQVAALFTSARDVPSIAVVKHYHRHPLYLDALERSVRAHWAEHGQAERLLLSFHGIPQRNVDRGDPYLQHCEETAQQLAARLELEPARCQIAFQSRLGRAQWLQPYTSVVLAQWGAEHVASVDVLSPAFAADCLETLEEIAVENRDIFQRAGGGEYRYIPCLNDSEPHIDMLAAIVAMHLPALRSANIADAIGE
jgi:protoporphyrin/coproporphyrin ferrochelatase